MNVKSLSKNELDEIKSYVMKLKNLNTKIKLNDVQSILSKYNLRTTINNISLYERAFVHRSYVKRPDFENLQQNITIVKQPSDCLPLSSKSNERLENTIKLIYRKIFYIYI